MSEDAIYKMMRLGEDRYQITPDVQRMAVASWFLRPDMSSTNQLRDEIMRFDVPSEYCWRAADQLVQKLRKAGVIEHVAGEWRKVSLRSTATPARISELAALLEEADRQLAYLDERSPSGTTPAVRAKIRAALNPTGEA